MALTAPTIQDIQSNIITDLESRFGTPIPLLSKAVWRVLAVVLSGIWIILYTYGSDAFKQRFIQTCNLEYLKLLGAVVGVTQQGSTTWQGKINVVSTGGTATFSAGAVQFVNMDTNIIYEVYTTTDIIVSGTNVVDIIALTGGDVGNLNISDELKFVSPYAGMNETALVLSVTIDGDDAELESVFRTRVLQAYQSTPQGGALMDYVSWSKDAPNVIGVYPYATIGTPGQIDVHIEVDNQTDGIPTAGQLTNIYNGYIAVDPITGLATRRPVTAEINMLPITRRAIDIDVVTLSPATQPIKDAIEAALESSLASKEPYIIGVSLTRNDFIKKSQLSSAVDNITESYSATFDDIVCYSGGVPFSSDVLVKGEKCKLGTVSYT
jgi:uncharacterized phage protein gp47/JayE